MKNTGQVRLVQNEGIYKSLAAQLEGVFRHANQGGDNSRETYEACLRRFCAHLSDDYRLQSLKNFDSKHVYSYADGMIERRVSTTSLYKEICAIRYLDRQLPGHRNVPEINDIRKYLAAKGKQIQNRKTADKERAWSPHELDKGISLAREQGGKWWKVEYLLRVDKNVGLRIGEYLRLTVEQIKAGIRDEVLHLRRGQAKHGRPRDIPLTRDGVQALKDLLRSAESRGIRNGYIVVDHKKGETMESVSKSLQNWLYRYRYLFQDADRGKGQKRTDLTSHGVRHRATQDTLQDNYEKYGNIKEARQATTQAIGHNRDQILDTYTVGSDLHKVKR